MSEGDRIARQPLLSIVTVTRNAGAALSRTSQSIAEQTFRDYEHLVKDGLSSDGSLAGVGAFPQARVVVRADRGIYDAMNQALEVCRGEWVLFLNAGDLFASPEALAAVASRLAEASEAGLVYCDYFAGEFHDVIVNPARVSPFFVYRTTLCHQVCFFRREVLARIGGFDTSLAVAADHDLLARAVVREGVRAVHVPAVAIRYEGCGFSRRPENRSRHRRELQAIRSRHFGLARRLTYALVLAGTLPGLRKAIFEWRALRVLRRPYLALVNELHRRRLRGGPAGG